MKNLFRLLILCAVLMPAAARADDFAPVRLSLIDGDVQVLIQDTTDWTPAAINLPLNEHDRIWVSDGGRTELQIQGGVYVRVDGNSGLDLLTVNRDSAQFYLDQGHIYINNRRGGIGTVQVDTPLASLRSYDNSIVMIDVSPDGVNEVSVLKGTVYAESKVGATTVTAGNTLTIAGEDSAQLSPIGSPDDWEQWNVDRDRQVSAWNESSRYLPDELHEYASDFDQNGRWQYAADYGYVWSPAGVSADWSPYSYGNWVWVRSNYVWIDSASWGWAPFHYGRWVLIGGGWCWVPPAMGAVYWSPGYVGWVVTPTYVSWVPLAPGEIYYGYGYYGPASVNITTVNINTIVVNNNYRNARNIHSVMTVNRDTFGTGRHDPVRLKDNPFAGGGRGRPAPDKHIIPPLVKPAKPVVITNELLEQKGGRVRPDHERMQPPPRRSGGQDLSRPDAGSRPDQPQSRPTYQKPPERVQKTRPETIKNERPLIKQRQASVFSPRQPDNLPVRRSNEPRNINRRPDSSAVPLQQHRPQQHQQQHGQGNPERGNRNTVQ